MVRTVFFILLSVYFTSACGQNRLIHEDFETAKGNLPPAFWKQDIINGVYALDSFFFEDSLYSFAEGISGRYALFDSYLGGQNTATNANGIGEEVALVSPQSSTIGLNNLNLSFDYYFVAFSKASAHVDVSLDGTFWTTIWSASKSTETTQHVSLDLKSYIGQSKFFIRIRWLNGSTLPNQGYLAIDNFELFEMKAQDVSVDGISSPLQSSCRNDSQTVIVRIANSGVDSVFKVPVILTITGDSSLVFHDTLPYLAPGETKESYIGSYSSSKLDSVLLEAETILLGDSVVWNNVYKATIHHAKEVVRPDSGFVSGCGIGKYLLISSGNDQMCLWYDSLSSLEVLGLGDSFLTPTLTSSTSFYMANAVTTSRVLTTHQGPWRYNGSPTGGSYFNLVAHQDLVISGFQQHCAYASSNVRIKLYSKNGRYQGSERDKTDWNLIYDDSVTTLGWGKYLELDIKDIYLKNGDSIAFYLVVSGSASPTFKKQVISKNLAGLEIFASAINGIEFANPLAGYSWDGKVLYQTLCVSDRSEYKVKVKPLPTGAYLKRISGNLGSGSISDPYIVAENSVIDFELFPPTEYRNQEYGSKWVIKQIEMNSGYSLIPSSDTTFMAPDSNRNGEFRYTPGDSWAGTTIEMNVIVHLLESGCDSIITQYIHIAAVPKVKFHSSVGCENEEIYFADSSSIDIGSVNTMWYFGDGDSSASGLTKHQYPSAGTYAARLLVTSDLGIRRDSSFSVIVKETPIAAFNNKNACEGEPIVFTNTSKTPSSSATFNWNFGDGTGSDSRQPEHQYINAGAYKVVLIVEEDGCTDSISKTVYQFHRPQASFVAAGNCANSVISFTNTSTFKGEGEVGSMWFMYKTAKLLTGKSLEYIYPDSGKYFVTLIAVSQFNCTDTVARWITIDPSPKVDFNWDQACDQTPTQFENKTPEFKGGVTNYTWVFNGKDTSHAYEPLYSFLESGVHTVSLRAVQSNKCSSTLEKQLYVGNQPIADFETGVGCSGEAISFVNTSYNTFGSIDFLWDFADGDSSSAFAPKHTYNVSQMEQFNVKLEARAQNGCSSSIVKSVLVDVAPSCEFSFTRSDEDRQLFTFDALDKSAASYVWLFEGDGSSTLPSPTHRFTYPDETYKVILTAESSNGCSCGGYEQTISTSWGMGLSPSDSFNLAIWPNPSEHFIYLRLQIPSRVEFEIFSLEGALVKEWSMQGSEFTLDVRDLNASTYILRATADGIERNYRITIIRN